MNEEELPQAHKNFTRHFTATFYEDESCEFAPFGSDEGWDTLQEAAENRNVLNSGSTVADVLEITEAPHIGRMGQNPIGMGMVRGRDFHRCDRVHLASTYWSDR